MDAGSEMERSGNGVNATRLSAGDNIMLPRHNI